MKFSIKKRDVCTAVSHYLNSVKSKPHQTALLLELIMAVCDGVTFEELVYFSGLTPLEVRKALALSKNYTYDKDLFLGREHMSNKCKGVYRVKKTPACTPPMSSEQCKAIATSLLNFRHHTQFWKATDKFSFLKLITLLMTNGDCMEQNTPIQEAENLGYIKARENIHFNKRAFLYDKEGIKIEV